MLEIQALNRKKLMNMKKLIYLSLIIFFACSCGKTIVTPISKEQIVGQWAIEFFNTTGTAKSQLIGTPAKFECKFIEFKENGTITGSMDSISDVVFKGTWQIRTDNDFNIVINTSNKTVEWNIRHTETNDFSRFRLEANEANADKRMISFSMVPY